MFNNSLGLEIMKLRKSLKITQAQLSKDICSQATISMIEKGKIIPGLDILYLIALKLNISLSYFANIMLNENYSYTNSIVIQIEALTTEHNYNLVYKIVKRELSFEQKDKWYNIFLKWTYYLSSYKLNHLSIEMTLIKLKTLVEDTSNNTILRKDFLDEKIYNTIAILFATNNNYERALFYYNKINLNKNFATPPRLNQEIYYLRITYNKAKTYYDMKNYEHAKDLIQTGIEKSIKLENISLIGNFYYYLGQVQEKLSYPISEVQVSFKKAYFFFKLLNRTSYLEIIENKKNFINNDQA